MIWHAGIARLTLLGSTLHPANLVRYFLPFCHFYPLGFFAALLRMGPRQNIPRIHPLTARRLCRARNTRGSMVETTSLTTIITPRDRTVDIDIAIAIDISILNDALSLSAPC